MLRWFWSLSQRVARSGLQQIRHYSSNNSVEIIIFFWTSLFSIRELRFDGVRSFVLWECIWLNQFYFRFRLKTCPLHPASLSRADLHGLWLFSKRWILLFYIGWKLCHSKGGAGARARARVDLRPRSLAYSCHLCMHNSTGYSRGVAGLCIHSSQL